MIWHKTGLNRSTVNGSHYRKTILYMTKLAIHERVICFKKIYVDKSTLAASLNKLA